MVKEYRISEKGDYDRHLFDPSEHGEIERVDGEKALQKNLLEISKLQQKLYAEKKEGLILIFQAMDAAGKDGTISAVLGGLSPHGVTEYAFKTPTSVELSHDYLWRIQKCVPGKGEIAIFNRSQYEDVLIGKVHKLYVGQAHARRIELDHIIENRYEDILAWEKYLYRNSVRTVKFFLNVSKDEQARRFLSRIEDKKKNWKFSAGDVQEREHWEAYQDAYEKAINETSTRECPWYVIPADHKWYMLYAVSKIVRETLEEMDPKWPEVSEEDAAQMETLGNALRGELPKHDPMRISDEEKPEN